MIRTETVRTKSIVATLLFGAVVAAPTVQATDVPPLTEFQANTTAVASEVNDNFSAVRDAVNSKQDEATAAGIEFTTTAAAFSLSEASRTTVRSATVTVPAAGLIEVSFSAQTFINHVFTGEQFGGNGLNCRIERDGVEIASSLRIWDVLFTEPSGARNMPMSISVAATEASPGSVTIAATCRKQGTVTVQVSRPSLTVKYFEHRY